MNWSGREGQQPTWSQAFREEFRSRRGYDLLPFLPALARRIVDSREVTDRFLEDFRWTIGDLMANDSGHGLGSLRTGAESASTPRPATGPILTRTSTDALCGEQ